MSTINIIYSVPSTTEGLPSYSLRVEAVSAVDMVTKIFVMHSDLDDRNEFSHIATPTDIEEFPEDAPDLANEMPYFRVSAIDLVFRSYTELSEVKIMIGLDIDGLVHAINVLNSTPTTEEVVYDGQ